MGASSLDIDGFRQPHSRQEIIPITEQAIGPLRRRMIKGLTICTTAEYRARLPTTLNVTRCSGQMRRSSRVRHQFETAVFNDIASTSPSLRTLQLRSCDM